MPKEHYCDCFHCIIMMMNCLSSICGEYKKRSNNYLFLSDLEAIRRKIPRLTLIRCRILMLAFPFTLNAIHINY